MVQPRVSTKVWWVLPELWRWVEAKYGGQDPTLPPISVPRRQSLVAICVRVYRTSDQSLVRSTALLTKVWCRSAALLTKVRCRSTALPTKVRCRSTALLTKVCSGPDQSLLRSALRTTELCSEVRSEVRLRRPTLARRRPCAKGPCRPPAACSSLLRRPDWRMSRRSC